VRESLTGGGSRSAATKYGGAFIFLHALLPD
jgi:hypothetical protein